MKKKKKGNERQRKAKKGKEKGESNRTIETSW